MFIDPFIYLALGFGIGQGVEICKENPQIPRYIRIVAVVLLTFCFLAAAALPWTVRLIQKHHAPAIVPENTPTFSPDLRSTQTWGRPNVQLSARSTRPDSSGPQTSGNSSGYPDLRDIPREVSPVPQPLVTAPGDSLALTTRLPPPSSL